MSDAGKGDRYRPVDREKWDRNYERTFGKSATKDVDDEPERPHKEHPAPEARLA